MIIGNWKMNPSTESQALKLAEAVDKEGAILCPPFIYLSAVSRAVKNALLCAQDVFWEEKGAFTGEISATQLKEFGLKYVLVGHSERRALGETDAMVAKKLRACHKNGLIPVLCIGESKEAKDEDKTKDILKDQIERALFQVEKDKDIIIAYEPIWAIGSGSPADPKEVSRIADYILEVALPLSKNVKVIYGGSVDSNNLSNYLTLSNISGALAGGSSLKAQEFSEMLESIKT